MEYHHDKPAPPLERPLKKNLFDVLQKWDRDFIGPHEVSFVLELIMGANFLGVGDLVELGCDRAAEWINEKSVEEIREVFGVENDFGPGEEETLQKEHGIDKFGF